jgi:DNA-binding beta-propeller fold protein YncE
MYVIEKADAVGFAAAVRFTWFGMTSGLNNRFGIVGADPTPSDQGLTTAYAAYHGSDLLGEYASTLTITGTPALGDVGYTEAGPGINGTGSPPSADQPGFPGSIDTGDNRFLTVTETNGSLWIGADDACTPAGDSTTRACGLIIQVDNLSSPTVASDVDLGLPGGDIYYPAAIATACSDQLFVTFTMSSSSAFAAAGETNLAIPVPSPGTFSIKSYGAGTTAYLGGAGESEPFRWGDYSGVSPDGSDVCNHGPWMAAEFGGTAAGQPNWSTAIGQFTVDAPTVTSVAPHSGPAGTSVAITGTSFEPGSIVLFGSVPASRVTFVDGDHLTAVAPVQTPGTVDITVTTPFGTSPTSKSDQFTYPVLVFVANAGAHDVTSFAIASPTKFPPGKKIVLSATAVPHEIAIAPNAKTAYVTDAADNGVIPVNLANDLPEPIINTGAGASGISVTPNGRFAIVANTTANTVTRIDLTTLTTKSVALPPAPTQVAITPDSSTAFVTDFTGNTVTALHIATMSSSSIFPVYGAWGDTISSDGTTLWVTSPGTPGRSALVYEISTSSGIIEATVPLDNKDTRGIVETPDMTKLFVADDTQNSVTEILTGTPPVVGPTFPSGPGSLELATNPAGSLAFTTDNGGSEVTAINTTGPSAIATVAADTNPYGLAATRPLIPACPFSGLSQLTLGFTPAQVAPGGLALEIGDVYDCDAGGPMTVAVSTAVPSGCPAVSVPNRTFTPKPGDNPLLRGFAAPSCAGTYTETMSLQQGGLTLTSTTAQYKVT